MIERKKDPKIHNFFFWKMGFVDNKQHQICEIQTGMPLTQMEVGCEK